MISILSLNAGCIEDRSFAVAINNTLDKSYSINGSIVDSFSFADTDALSNFDFFGLPDYSIPCKPTSYNDSQKQTYEKHSILRGEMLHL